eukprot:16438626-Heterocapsa_arctica.AAC.1
MQYQAEKKKEGAFFAKVQLDPVKLAMACEEFDRLNPPGRFRKQLIDWTQWKKRFSVTSAVTVRQGEEEWSHQDFSDEKSKCNWDAARIKA